jgi:FKBP-type peptidyl-prolyl cis-trans isomerase SlyD
LNIKDKSAVGIHFTLTSDSGETISSSDGKEPMKYLHGSGMLVPGLERALEGRAPGDAFQVIIQPDDGYGKIDPELVQRVEPSVLAGMDDLQVGMQLEAQGPEGHTHFVIVREISDAFVTLDGNAPLAGMVLHFDITVDSVREATEQELEHGHVH